MSPSTDHLPDCHHYGETTGCITACGLGQGNHPELVADILGYRGWLFKLLSCRADIVLGLHAFGRLTTADEPQRRRTLEAQPGLHASARRLHCASPALSRITHTEAMFTSNLLRSSTRSAERSEQGSVAIRSVLPLFANPPMRFIGRNAIETPRSTRPVGLYFIHLLNHNRKSIRR